MPRFPVLLLLAMTSAIANAQAPLAQDPVVRALRQGDVALDQQRPRHRACQTLQSVTTASPAQRQVLAAELAGKLRDKDLYMLYARGDAARLGLYGFRKNQQDALRFYTQAAEQKSAESGYNAALILYRHSRAQPDQTLAERILRLLRTSNAVDANAKGEIAAQAHYLAGLIYERGWAGEPDVGRAFLHYRISARNSYVPGVEAYLRWLANSLQHLDAHEREPHLRELRMLSGRWKWHAPNIMRLVGDFYAAGWIQDSDGFHAQYHWRIAARMGGGQPGTAGYPQTVADAAQERRLEEAVNAALRNNQVAAVKHDLEFATLCF